QEFRDLFSADVLAPGRRLAMQHLALLAGSLEPANGSERADGLRELMRQLVARGNGAIVKEVGDATTCAFHRLEDAVEAAIAIQRAIDAPSPLKLGLHEGPVVATTAEARIDYFGRTVDLATSLRRESRGRDVVMLPETLEAMRGVLDGRGDIAF